MLPLGGSANKCLDVPSFTISWSLLSVLLLLTSPPANLLERRCPVGGEPPGGPDVPLECRGFSCGVASTLPAGLLRAVVLSREKNYLMAMVCGVGRESMKA